jgi:hypothetical protein
MKKLLTLLALLTLIFACDVEEKITPEDREAIAAEIKTEFHNWINSMSGSQKEFDMSVWVESDDEAWMGKPALWFNMMTLFPDQEKIREVWEPVGETRSATNFKVDEEYVAVVSDDCAVYTFKGTFSITDIDGNTGPDIPMSGTYVYVERNDQWKMLHMHQSWKNE